jgi:hypothetical protein
MVLPSIVMQDNQEALMITYASGGSTPGILCVVRRPKLHTWRMWVSIIPVGGLETTWEDWKTFQNNLKLQQTIKA